MKTLNIESRSYWTGKYTVCRHVRASFSPEILQAVAVKGLSGLCEGRLSERKLDDVSGR